jgi:uncharacterized protein YbcI
MATLGSLGEITDRENGPPCHRTKGQIEAEVSKAIIRFDREHYGRGPADVRTRIVQDMIIVRSTDVLTPTEHALVESGSVELVKAVRSKLYESHRAELNQMLRTITGSEIISMHRDLSTRTGERLIVFILKGDLEANLA